MNAHHCLVSKLYSLVGTCEDSDDNKEIGCKDTRRDYVYEVDNDKIDNRAGDDDDNAALMAILTRLMMLTMEFLPPVPSVQSLVVLQSPTGSGLEAHCPEPEVIMVIFIVIIIIISIVFIIII